MRNEAVCIIFLSVSASVYRASDVPTDIVFSPYFGISDSGAARGTGVGIGGSGGRANPPPSPGGIGYPFDNRYFGVFFHFCFIT
jgi:hypothetical protein